MKGLANLSDGLEKAPYYFLKRKVVQHYFSYGGKDSIFPGRRLVGHYYFPDTVQEQKGPFGQQIQG